MNRVLLSVKAVVGMIARCYQMVMGMRNGSTAPTTTQMSNGSVRNRGFKMLRLVRKRETADGIFGVMTVDGDPFSCVTVERKAEAIPTGTYDVTLDYSPRLQIITPHVRVPVRDHLAGGDAGIRIHPANFPVQLHGCIAVGNQEEVDAVDNSKTTFAALMAVLAGKPTQITIMEIV